MIINDNPNLSEQLMVLDLMRRMLKLDQDLRPSAWQVLHHPSFWDADKILKFILKDRLDSDASVVGGDWIIKFNQSLAHEFNKICDKVIIIWLVYK